VYLLAVRRGKDRVGGREGETDDGEITGKYNG